MQPNSPGTPKEQLRGMQILCTALMTGPLVFLAVIICLVVWNGGGFRKDIDVNKYFVIAAAIIGIICLAAAASGYKSRLSKTHAFSRSFSEKLENYRALLILYFATCEGAALFSVIALFLTGNYWVILIFLVMESAMFSRRPTRQRVIDELQLNFEEQQQLD